MRDSRITKVGYILRKYKFDELPQLLNVLQGTMSFVGPRPEVRKYVELYNDDQLNVLKVKPGITDYASIEYSNENELLGNASDPDQLYVEVIMPAKLSLNLKYIQEISITTDVKLILQTIKKIIS
jgi:lipopolysaccharide/colanic/teichoic acid biosynthesis glycosyltransferase